MSYNPRYDKGDWKGDCDICGRTFKALSLRKRWDGFMVCQEDWETRHPQDFVRGIADIQVPVFTRPEPSDIFIGICTLNGRSSIPRLALAGCSISGNTIYDPSLVPPEYTTIWDSGTTIWDLVYDQTYWDPI